MLIYQLSTQDSGLLKRGGRCKPSGVDSPVLVVAAGKVGTIVGTTALFAIEGGGGHESGKCEMVEGA